MSSPGHSHGESHSHTHNSGEQHGHTQSHTHKTEDTDTHSHSHGHGHSHNEGNNHGHGHGHGHGHSHDNKNGHGHAHGHSHGDTNNWEFEAGSWDDMSRVYVQRLIEKLTTQPWYNKESTVLDYGCGTGLMLRLLADDGLVGVSKGIDVEQKMVDNFQKHIDDNEKYSDVLSVRLLKGIDGSDAGLEKHNEYESFDIVTSTFVLGHVFEGNVDKVIDSIARCVKVGGHLVISEFDSGVKTGEENAAHVSDGGHFHTVFTEASMTEHLAKRGFDTEHAVVVRDVLVMGKGEEKMEEDFFRIFVEKK